MACPILLSWIIIPFVMTHLGRPLFPGPVLKEERSGGIVTLRVALIFLSYFVYISSGTPKEGCSYSFELQSDVRPEFHIYPVSGT